jgi:drug/metabolite transporter (DMT)-like permease
MLITGIVLGLFAGLTQSVSYIFSRMFVTRRRSGPMQLLVLGHVIMGAISALILPFLWSDKVPAFSAYGWPMAACAGFYLLGQLAFFAALSRSDASRLSPLLALKIVFLACLSAFFLKQELAYVQWLGVFLSVVAAFLLNYTGGRLPWLSLITVLAACLFYSLSDLNIKIFVDRLAGMGTLHAIFLGVSLCYLLCGLIGLVFLPWVGGWSKENLRYAAPFALSWLIAMFFLFASFALVGVVFGNILQSTRGVFSILIGAGLAKMGMEHLEQKTSRAVFVRRLAAAVLMCLAILLYVSPNWQSAQASAEANPPIHAEK